MALAQKLGTLPRRGEQIDRYGVVAEIAHGGMAAVYAVTRAGAPGFDKLLAMKVMLPHLASDERFVAMFTDEARIAARINHPNVVQVFDVGHSPFPHLVLEFVHGQSLSGLLRHAAKKQSSALTRGLICRILADTADGLHAAHEARGVDGEPLGIVHRDVSPQNVLVGYDGQVKVVDFGVAAARGRIASTRTGEMKGKIAFMAPEQLTRRPVDRRTDLWSFGVMAWQIFARRKLFKGASESETMWNVVNREVPDIEDLDPSIPPAVAEVIHACLSRELPQRPTNASVVADVFRKLANSEPDTGGAALAGLMADVFGEERAVEDARLAEAVRDHDLTLASGVGGMAATSSVSVTDSPSSRFKPVRAFFAATAVLVLVGGGIFWWLDDAGATDNAQPLAPEVRTAEVEPVVPERDDPSAEPQIELRVSPAVETVLVDDVPHPSRPILAPIGATLTLIGMDRVRRHQVRSDDQGTLLELMAETRAEAGALPSSMRVRSQTPMRQPDMRPSAPPPAGESSQWMPLE